MSPTPFLVLTRVAGIALGLSCVVVPALAQSSSPAQAGAASSSAPAVAQATRATLRTEFADPINAAQELLRAGQAQEAMQRLNQAVALPDPTPQETMLLHRTRAAVAQQLGLNAVVVDSLDKALQTALVSAAEEPGLLEAVVSYAFREKDFARVARWSQRYFELGGSNRAISLMRVQSLLSLADEPGALKVLSVVVATDERDGRAVSESQWRLLWQLQRKHDAPRAVATLERLVSQYPRPENWRLLIAEGAQQAGGSERVLVMFYRLLRASGGMDDADTYEALVSAALGLGQPAEALLVVEEGFGRGLLGQGPRAAEHQRLRDRARRSAQADQNDRPAAEAAARTAASGDALVALGWAQASALNPQSAPQQVDAALRLIEQGLAKGGLRRPIEARLQQGISQWMVGRKDAARQTLRSVADQAGGDPLDQVARQWSLWAQSDGALLATPALKP